MLLVSVPGHRQIYLGGKKVFPFIGISCKIKEDMHTSGNSGIVFFGVDAWQDLSVSVRWQHMGWFARCGRYTEYAAESRLELC